MRTITTFYHFKITTSERIMHAFGTVMSHSDEGVLIDLWCPEEPRLTQRVFVSHQNIREAFEALIREQMKKTLFLEREFTIQLLSY